MVDTVAISCVPPGLRAELVTYSDWPGPPKLIGRAGNPLERLPHDQRPAGLPVGFEAGPEVHLERAAVAALGGSVALLRRVGLDRAEALRPQSLQRHFEQAGRHPLTPGPRRGHEASHGADTPPVRRLPSVAMRPARQGPPLARVAPAPRPP